MDRIVVETQIYLCGCPRLKIYGFEIFNLFLLIQYGFMMDLKIWIQLFLNFSDMLLYILYMHAHSVVLD